MAEATRQYGIAPDVLTTAKGLGGGFPVGAMLATAAAAQALPFGTHGSTYGGNPLACAVAGAVLDELEKPALQANAKAREQQLRAGLDAIGERYGLFSKTRGMGLLIGAPLLPAWHGRAKDIVNAALKEGLWLLVAGPDVLRFAPALNITEADVGEGLTRFERACQRLTTA